MTQAVIADPSTNGKEPITEEQIAAYRRQRLGVLSQALSKWLADNKCDLVAVPLFEADGGDKWRIVARVQLILR